MITHLNNLCSRVFYNFYTHCVLQNYNKAITIAIALAIVIAISMTIIKVRVIKMVMTNVSV